MIIQKNFISIDGPNGVGKSAVINILKDKLTESKLDFILTKEPTNSPLGNFIRENQNSYYSNTLAALVAADRYDHISKLIIPHSDNGKLVISDRYIASSLVYQVLDGLEYDFILRLNSKIILPSLYFILTANNATIFGRLKDRSQLTRFELDQEAKEGKLFESAGEFLRSKGVIVKIVDNESRTTDETASEIADEILNHL